VQLSVVRINCCWVSPAQSFLVPSPAVLFDHILLSHGLWSHMIRCKDIAHTYLYRVSQEERSVFWEVTVSAILCKKVCIYMWPIPNGFRDRAVSLYSTLYRRATRHALTRVAKCIDVDGDIFENVLFCLNCTNFVT
jgi:hypothetical protein